MFKTVDKFKTFRGNCSVEWFGQISKLSKPNKVELTFKKNKNIYNNESISFEAELLHYRTVIRPESLHVYESPVLKKKREIENLEKRRGKYRDHEG